MQLGKRARTDERKTRVAPERPSEKENPVSVIIQVPPAPVSYAHGKRDRALELLCEASLRGT